MAIEMQNVPRLARVHKILLSQIRGRITRKVLSVKFVGPIRRYALGHVVSANAKY